MKTQLMIVGLLVLGITYGVQGYTYVDSWCTGKKEGDHCNEECGSWGCSYSICRQKLTYCADPGQPLRLCKDELRCGG